MPFKKGKSGNPKGRPPILLPELQREIDQDRNAIKSLILKYLKIPMGELESNISTRELAKLQWGEYALRQCLDRIAVNGDIDGYRKVLELVLGRIPEEQTEFPISEEEKRLILVYRQRLSEARSAIPTRGGSGTGVSRPLKPGSDP